MIKTMWVWLLPREGEPVSLPRTTHMEKGKGNRLEKLMIILTTSEELHHKVTSAIGQWNVSSQFLESLVVKYSRFISIILVQTIFFFFFFFFFFFLWMNQHPLYLCLPLSRTLFHPCPLCLRVYPIIMVCLHHVHEHSTQKARKLNGGGDIRDFSWAERSHIYLKKKKSWVQLLEKSIN